MGKKTSQTKPDACKHKQLAQLVQLALVAEVNTTTCPLCNQKFELKLTEVVGASHRPVPYWTIRAIPVNDWGWIVGESILLD